MCARLHEDAMCESMRTRKQRTAAPPTFWCTSFYADLKAIFLRYMGSKNIIVAHSYGTSNAWQLCEAL